MVEVNKSDGSARPALRRRRAPSLRTGSIINETFRVWAANFPALLVFCIIFSLPLFAVVLVTRYMGWVETQRDITIFSLVVAIIAYQTTFALGGTISFGVFRSLQKDPASFEETLRVGLRGLIPVSLAGVVVVLICCIGFILLFVPGIIASCMLVVVAPAIINEKIGVLDALKRSRELTRGNLGAIFGASFIINIICRGVDFGIGTILRHVHPESTANWLLYFYLSVLAASLFSVLCAVIYYSLRENRGDLDETVIAEVFA